MDRKNMAIEKAKNIEKEMIEIEEWRTNRWTDINANHIQMEALKEKRGNKRSPRKLDKKCEAMERN